jgi:hypothetical protein
MSLFPNKYRLALGNVQPLIKRVLGILFLVVKLQEHETDHSSPSSPEVKREENFIFILTCVFIFTSYLSKGQVLQPPENVLLNYLIKISIFQQMLL